MEPAAGDGTLVDYDAGDGLGLGRGLDGCDFGNGTVCRLSTKDRRLREAAAGDRERGQNYY
jgi:hypothetical protein